MKIIGYATYDSIRGVIVDARPDLASLEEIGSAAEGIEIISLFKMTRAMEDIAIEISRQVEEEGFTPEKDDTLPPNTLASLSASYLVAASAVDRAGLDYQDEAKIPGLKELLPLAPAALKLKGRRRDAIRGLAVGVKAVEALDRAS